MFKNKFIIFIMLIIVLLSVSAVSAEDSSVNTTQEAVSINIDDSSTEVVTSAYDENTSLDVASKDSSQSDDIKTFNDFSNENTQNYTESGEDDFYNNDLISSNKDTTQNNLLGSGETYETFTNLEKLINQGGSDLTLSSNYKMINDESGSFTTGIIISKNINIDGNGFTIDANKLGRIFNINSGVTLSLTNLTLANANTNEDKGGAIYNSGKLILTNVIFANNSAKSIGGAFYNGYNSKCDVKMCTFVNNSAVNSAGAFWNYGSGLVNSCTFVNNSAVYGGGAISTNGSSLVVSNCTFVKNVLKPNSNSGWGGAISKSDKGSISVNNCTFVSNFGFFGGAFSDKNEGPTSLSNCVFVSNSAVKGGAIMYVGSGDVSNCVFVNNSASESGNAICTGGLVVANDNWWGDNNPIWEKLVYGKEGVTHNTYAVLNLTANNDVVYLKFYKNGTNTIMDIPTRDIKLTIGNQEPIYDKIAEGNFEKNYVAPEGNYVITASVDNEKQTVNFVNHVYVDPNGSDENNGFDWGNAVETIEHAMAIVPDNGRIYLSDGSHIVNKQIDIDKTVTIIGNGTKSSITNNRSGNGVFKITANDVAIYNSTFINNSATEGGAIYNSGSGLVVSGCAFVNNSATKGGAIYTSKTVVANDNWWGNNTPNWEKLVSGDVTHDTYAVLNLTATDSIINIKFYKNGTTDILPFSRDVILTIGNQEPIYDEIVKGIFTQEYSAPTGGYTISATVDNQILSITFKIITELNVAVNNITYGDDLIIDANITKGVTGNVTIIIDDDKEYNATISNGKIHYAIPDLGAGDYKITVRYEGSDDYTSVDFNKTINVAPSEANLKVSIANVTYGNASIITVNLTGVKNTKLNGTVVVEINDGKYEINVENGFGISDEVKLIVGTYDFDAVWDSNNDNYTKTVVHGNFNVSKTDLNIVIKAEDINVDQNATIVVSGLANATGNVTIKVNNETYDVKIENGVVTKSITGLKAGNYTLTVIYQGDDNYNNASASANLTVTKLDSDIGFKVNNITYGENITIAIDLPIDATGNLTITVDGEEYSIVDVKNPVIIDDLNAGNHTITIKYSGDDRYAESSSTSNITVTKADSKLEVNINSINYGELLNITAALTGVNNTQLNGNITITINGKNYTVEINGGVCSYDEISLPAGEYEFNAIWSGNNNYNGATVNGGFKISIINPTIKVDVSDVEVGQNTTVVVTLPEDAQGSVTITIDGENYTFEVIDGIATKNITINKPGNHTVNVVYNGDNNYNSVMDSANFTVSRVSNYNMTIDADNITVGENATITITLPKDADGNVVIFINGNKYSGIVKNGTAIITIPGLSVGEYNATVVYGGNNKYDSNQVNTTFKVIDDKGVILTTNDVVMIYKDGSRLIATLIDTKGNPVANATISFIINGVTYNKTTDENGTAYLTINLNPGFYNATVIYPGNATYGGVSANATVEVNSSIVGNDVIKMYQNGTQFYATFYGANGDVLGNANVRFNINGVFYTRTTDENGTAKLNINLNPGNYTLTTYNDVTGEQKGFTVVVEPLLITADLTKYYINGSKFEAKVYNYDGSPAVNKEVTFNINGVFYTRTSDENGIVKLAINLRPGNYIITSMYEGLSIGNTVKVLPTLETSDLSMNYRDGSSFNVKTLDGEGNPLANQNITFNVNGVFYHKTTGSDGIANLEINLMKGKYIITSYWEDYEIGNNIVIA